MFSYANAQVFKVYLKKLGNPLLTVNEENPFLLQISQQGDKLSLGFKTFFVSDLRVEIINDRGEIADTIFEGVLDQGKYNMKYDTHELGTGKFSIRVSNSQGQISNACFNR